MVEEVREKKWDLLSEKHFYNLNSFFEKYIFEQPGLAVHKK
jgi:hypothetical protein